MANPEHVKILKKGVNTWNNWRDDNLAITPDLTEANLRRAYLNRADLTGADLLFTIFGTSNLSDTNFDKAELGYTHLANLDLSSAKNLKSINHAYPSTIGIDTIYKSKGRIPEVFLRGCGVPDVFIEYMPSLVGAIKPFDFYSCFISHSTEDGEFAKRLHEGLQSAGVRCWYAPHDMQGGKPIVDQIDKAIKFHDKLLLVLSTESMQSNWVEAELISALKAEENSKKRKLFPIRLADMDSIKAWKCFNSDTGKNMAADVRKYHIPDFSNWKDHDSYTKAFDRLIRDLKAEME